MLKLFKNIENVIVHKMYSLLASNIYMVTPFFQKPGPSPYPTYEKIMSVLGHPQAWQLEFQIPATPIAEGIIAFHDDLMVFLTFILFFVIIVLGVCLKNFTSTKKNGESDHLVHASTLEIVWTLIPALILIIIAVPSFSLLYSVDEIVEPLLTLKIIGHQWYWSYEFFNADNLATLLNLKFNSYEFYPEPYEAISSFDSYMLSDEDLANKVGLTSYRLYTVDKHIGLPAHVPTRLLMTSNDVLHSWGVPSLGVKVDACPGRLNQSSLYIKYLGIFYGQCSEICGTNHAFMPIGIVTFDLNIPNYILEDVFSDLEPILHALSLDSFSDRKYWVPSAKFAFPHTEGHSLCHRRAKARAYPQFTSHWKLN